jgi:hypothetical protein
LSLFDFPRIHYSGLIDLNVPTINNTVNFPLSLYDATHSVAFTPPRLYFSSQAIILHVQASIRPTIYFDQQNSYWYIEIEPLQTIELIKAWCMVPIVTNDPNRIDAAYGPFYEAAASAQNFQNRGLPFLGNCPGYWNMYGDMGVTIHQTFCSGVQLFNGQQIQSYSPGMGSVPPTITKLLGTSFNLNTTPDSGITTALMVETVSNQSIYANIFCSQVNVFNAADASDVYLSGQPFKFSAGIYGTWKVVNWLPAMASAGRFFSAIPMDAMNGGLSSPLVQFFQQNKAYDNRPLKGLCVSFTIQDVFEYRYDPNQYAGNHTDPYPAQANTAITITPWYEGDLIASVAGRSLISLNAQPIYQNTGIVPNQPIPINMNPCIFSHRIINAQTSVFTIDMGSSWPELINPPFVNGQVQPAKRGDASFETASLGAFNFMAGNLPFGSISVNPAINPLKKLFSTGNLVDFVIQNPNTTALIQTNLISMFLNTGAANSLALQEAEYYITTDQKGPYHEADEDPSHGFMVYSEKKEPIRLRIFRRGIPVATPTTIGICQYIIPEGANDPFGPPTLIKWLPLADQAILDFKAYSIDVSQSAVYYFVYPDLYPQNKIPAFVDDANNYTIMDTGYFICMRAYQPIDYAQYLDPSHPAYAPPDFQVIYDQVFKMYDLVYPIMALKHPFTEAEWNNGTMAGAVLQRTDPKNWNNIIYMPRSRELSKSQRKLLKAWADNILNQPS